MATNYPSGLDSFATDADNITVISANESNNQNAAILALERYGRSAYNVRTYGGAKGDGTTDDTTAIQVAITAAQPGGGIVYLPPGSYLISAPLTISNASGVSFVGAGRGATTLKIAAGFSGVAAVNLTNCFDCAVADLTFLPPNTAFGSNPAADGVRLNHSQRCTVRDLDQLYLNGYGVNVLADTSGSCLWARLVNVHTIQCGQGAHILGNTNQGFNAGAFVTDCTFEQTKGVDGLLIEDAHDVTVSGLEAWNDSASTGASLHIKGNCAAAYCTNFSIGGLTGTTPQAAAAVLVESGANGTPIQIGLSHGIVENATPGLSVTAVTELLVEGVHFIKNGTNGATFSGSADRVTVKGCQFDLNGFTAGAGHYDLAFSGSGKCLVEGNFFITPVGSGSSQVTAAVSPTAGEVWVLSNWFFGATAFVTNFPKAARSNMGYNPVGSVTAPAIPASGTPLSAGFSSDMTVHITAGSSTCTVAVGGTTALTLAASGIGTVRIPINQTITLTYTNAPTWTWFGD